MEDLLELLVDTQSVTGRIVTTAAIVMVAVALSALISWVLTRGETDPYSRYYKRKITHYVLTFLSIIAIGITWRAFAGQAGVIVGLLAAGVAFAMQEVIGALAGWFNIMSGRIFRVGDRIDMGGVRGDVIDITPLRTKILEMGGGSSGGTEAAESGSWVKGRQYTGRIVAVSNKMTFTEPVFNYSAHLEWIWEEIGFSIGQEDDWEAAERIVLAVVSEHAPDLGGQGTEALEALGRRYLLSKAEVEPQTYVRVVEGDVEVVARFVVTVRAARAAKDAITRSVLQRFRDEGIRISYQTYAVTGLDSSQRAAERAGARAGDDA